MDELLKQVPKNLRDRFQEIVAIIDEFCDSHLNDEYKQLCREMAAAVCQEGSPVASGKARSWAGGIRWSVGWVNFLGDPSQTPHMTQEELAKALGVSVATVAAKSKVVRDGLDLRRMDPSWTLPSRLGDNPLVWMIQDRSGMIYDLRTAPRHVQEDAYRRGLIPFIPADRPRRGPAEE